MSMLCPTHFKVDGILVVGYDEGSCREAQTMLTCDRKYTEEGLTGFGMVMVNILGLKALLLVLLGIKQIA